MTRLSALPFALLILAALPACEGGPDLLDPEPCPGDSVTLSIQNGSDLDIVWAPACPVAWLEVFDHSTNVPTWTVSGRDGNVILPVVRYGHRPANALEVLAPTLLTPGRAYTVRVLRVIGSGPFALNPAGAATFTR